MSGATASLRPTIVAFYEALFARDAERLGTIIDEHFAPDAVLERPESLPGGGRTEGAERLKRMMAGAARAEGGPLDVGQMRIARLIEGQADERARAVDGRRRQGGRDQGVLLGHQGDARLRSPRSSAQSTSHPPSTISLRSRCSAAKRV